ncbi:RNA polymerase sigma factor [Arthrobacter sp. 1088]|uniref:RNA polymerase sigma factor n=1 Tax=Arthrobacter sp. 1088 TaxID=2817768 RepID=UPI0037BF6BEF
MVGGRHDAEDATAAAFLELWRRREGVRLVDGSILPWLLVTTTNTARNLQRS